MISVIIPAYNSVSTILDALESVAAQTLWERTDLPPPPLVATASAFAGSDEKGDQPFEVIIVDDGSTDDTVETVRSWLSGKQRPSEAWRILRQASNAGPAAARNAGIVAARGDWVAFLDADDLWVPGRLEVQLGLAAAHTDAVMFCGRPAPFTHGAGGIEESRADHGRWGLDGDRRITREELSEHNPIATSTVLIRRSVLEAVGGFDTQFRGPEDYDLWLRVASQGEIYYSSEILSRYRYGDLSLSTDDRRFLSQVARVLNKAYASGGTLHGMRGHRRALSYQHLAASWMAAERGGLARAWWLWTKALWLWPFWYGAHCRLPWGRLKLAVRLARKCRG